jgi:membrane fusion protein (multidrug efflux system)
MVIRLVWRLLCMPAPFSRTLRCLEADRGPHWGVALILAVLLAAWGGWAVLARVSIWEVTESARLEVDSEAHPITALVAGRVVSTRLRLGQEVLAGEVVVVLDGEAERRAVQEKQTRRRALGNRLAALRREIQVERLAAGMHRQAREAARKEARAQVEEAEIRAVAAESRAQTSQRLYPSRAVSTDDLRRDRAEADARRTGVRTLRLGGDRLEQDRAVQEAERLARIARLERDAVELEGEAAVEEAGIRRLDHDIALRSVRAPVAGRVGTVAFFPQGSVVRAAETLGSIVPPGPPHAVALFPVASVGRIRAGQAARLRLHGYPWTQYGTLAATVCRVGNEPREGRVRVELTVHPDPSSAIPLEHGLPGSAEVEVERAAPIVLALRAAGQLLRRREAAAANGEEP